MKLSDDLVDQMKPPRRQQGRPFGAFAIQLEQPDPALAMTRDQIDHVIEGDLRDRIAGAPHDRAAARIEDACHAGERWREGVIAIEAQLVVVRIGPPHGAFHQLHAAPLDVRLQVLRAHAQFARSGSML